MKITTIKTCTVLKPAYHTFIFDIYRLSIIIHLIIKIKGNKPLKLFLINMNQNVGKS